MSKVNRSRSRRHEVIQNPDGTYDTVTYGLHGTRRAARPGFWCQACGEVTGVKVTHPVRNWGSFFVGGKIGWAALHKQERYKCPHCGDTVRPVFWRKLLGSS